MAATELIRDMLYIKNLFDTLKLDFRLPVTLRVDNLNANGHANRTAVNLRTRYILLMQRFVTQHATNSIVRVLEISTGD